MAELRHRRYVITLHGCDASTSFVMDLTDDERALVERMSRLSDGASTYQCMPVLVVEKRADD